MILIIIMAKWYCIGTALQQTTVLAAQKVIERLGYCFRKEDECFVRGLDVLVSVSRLSLAKACVIVVYHDCKHQMNTSDKLA